MSEAPPGTGGQTVRRVLFDLGGTYADTAFGRTNALNRIPAERR